MIRIDIDKVLKAHVRCEGEVNQDWTLTMIDGTEHQFYAVEGSPQCGDDDTRVNSYDPKLADFLDRLAQVYFDISDIYTSDLDCVEYDIDLTTMTVHSVVVQRQVPISDDDYDYEYVPARRTFKVKI